MMIRTTTPRALLSLLVIAAVIGCGKGDRGEPLNSFHRYEIRNVHLTYDFIGNARGQEELFLADYGKYEARYSKYELLTTEAIRPMANAGITRLTDVYSIDVPQRQIKHMRPSELDSLYHLPEGSIPTPQEFLKNSMKNNLLREVGQDSVLGFYATRYQSSDGNAKLWLWRGMLIRKETMTREGMIGTSLTGMDTAWVVDTSKFSLPKSGFEVIEQPNK